MNRRVRDYEGYQNTERNSPAVGRLARLALARAEVVMIKRVQTKVVRKILRREHESERNPAKHVVSFYDAYLSGVCLFGPQIKVEREEHKENQQRVFFANPVVGDGVYADGPKRRCY